jgi:hypothetical protein
VDPNVEGDRQGGVCFSIKRTRVRGENIFQAIVEIPQEDLWQQER